VAAKHEKTTVGHIVGIPGGRGGWSYVFSIDGVKVDDSSQVCETPLAPGACISGPVLVYYSYEPFRNSRLEDFSVASKNAYRTGKLALAVCLPLLALSLTGFVILARKSRRDDDSDSGDDRSDSEEERLERKSSDQPEDLHIVPNE
jgi:hypothetical protein